MRNVGQKTALVAFQLHFSLKLFSQICFCLKDFTEVVRLFEWSANINRLTIRRLAFWEILTLPMLRLLLSKAQGCKNALKPLKAVMLVLSDEYQCARVLVIFQVFASFCMAKLVTSSIRRFYVLDIATDMQSTEGTLNPFIPVAPKTMFVILL